MCINIHVFTSIQLLHTSEDVQDLGCQFASPPVVFLINRHQFLSCFLGEMRGSEAGKPGENSRDRETLQIAWVERGSVKTPRKGGQL